MSEQFDRTSSSSPFNFAISPIEKISENPYALFFYVVSILQTLALYLSNSYDPITILFDLIESIVNQSDVPKVLKVLLVAISKVLYFELQHRKTAVIIFLFTVPSLLNFNLPYFFVELIISTILIFSSKISLWMAVLLAHVWYIYRLNDTFPKIYLILMTFVLLYFFIEIDYSDKFNNLELDPFHLRLQKLINSTV